MSARVAIYARVSTINHGQDVSLQTRELQQFAAARSWTIAGEYIDAGVSGSKDSRPELNRHVPITKSESGAGLALGFVTAVNLSGVTWTMNLSVSNWDICGTITFISVASASAFGNSP